MGEEKTATVGIGLDGVALVLPICDHDLDRIDLLGEIAMKASS